MTPIVGGLVVKYQVNTDTRDTVWSRIEIAATAAFLNPQVFWVRMSDTITSYSDTLTEAMGLAPAPAGYWGLPFRPGAERASGIFPEG